jgi:ATP-dependent Clp protease ATP-binding subunit ClpC
MFGWIGRLLRGTAGYAADEPYAPFTDRARKVMRLAHHEARHFNHEYIGTEHILLGLLEEGAGVAAHVLKHPGIDPLECRSEVESIVQHGPAGEPVVMDRLPHTPSVRRAIECSIE